MQKKKTELCQNARTDLHKEVLKVDDEMVNVMKQMQKKQFEKEVKHLEQLKSTKGKSSANFHLKDTILGKKKSPQERVVLVDPTTGKDVTTPKAIKEVSLKYCVNLLKNKEPKFKYINYVNVIKEKHKERMLEVIPNDMEELPFEAFSKAYKKILKKPEKNMSSSRRLE